MKAYLEKYRNRMIAACLFVLLVHEAKLSSPIVGVDTEAVISQQKDFYAGWLGIGRQGLVFLKLILNGSSFNPYFAGLMTLVFLAMSVTAFLMLWDGILGGSKAWGWIACAFLWIAHPVLTEQFYFSLQSMEICCGMLLTAIALYLVKRAGEGHAFWMYAVSVLILLIPFSMYQVFAPMYIFGTVTILTLRTLSREQGGRQSGQLNRQQGGKQSRKQEDIGIRGLARDILPWLGVFLAAFALNSLITALFFSGSAYLSDQVFWGRIPLADNLYRIAAYLIRSVFGYHNLYGHWVYAALCVIGLILVAVLWKKYGWVLAFYYLALQLTPFLMAFVCGAAPAVRSQLILPMMTGFLAYLDMLMLQQVGSEGKSGKVWSGLGILVGIFCLIGVWREVQTTESLYYTDACRYAQDEAIGRELIRRLEPLVGEEEVPVVVLGAIPFQGNPSCVKGETIGKSIFEQDTDVEPQYFWSTGRVLRFLHTLGYECTSLPAEQIPRAVEIAGEKQMPCWPAEGCVERYEDMVIIKLSQ